MPGSGSGTQELRETSLPLPVSWYADPAVLALEQRQVFDRTPAYVGHDSMVPETGSFRVVEGTDEAWMLVRGHEGVELVSNVCRHRQAVMQRGQGTVRNIVCPVHRWSYDLGGRQRAAPHFPEVPGLALDKRPLQRWNGLLFAGDRDVAADLTGFSMAGAFDYSAYAYQSTTVEHYGINWKTFMEIYLELYHVEAFHSGLRGYADCGVFEAGDWEFGDNWSNQVIALRADASRASEPYRRYLELVTELRGRPPRHAALWFCYYPNIMLEWYPEALAVSVLVPQSASSTLNIVDFFYPPEILADRPDIVEAHQEAYGESAGEDREIVERIDAGRRALYAQGRDDRGPYQVPLEDGMVHFHRWLADQLARGG